MECEDKNEHLNLPGMSLPGPSEAHSQQENDELVKLYSEMSDENILVHIKAILDEVSIRPSLTKNIPAVSTQDTDELSDISGLRDPKIEMLDEQYLIIHENPSGVQYNHDDGSYTWNSRFLSDHSAKRINQLNKYGGIRRHEHISPENEEEDQDLPTRCNTPAPRKRAQSVLTSRPSAKYWNRKGGDPFVDCSCSICNESFTTLRSLLDHRLEKHSEKAMLTCGLCGKECQKRTHMYLHLSQEYNVYRCTECNTSFASKWHLEKHRCKENDSEKREDRKRPAKADEIEVKQEIEDDGYGVENRIGTQSTNQLICGFCGKRYTHSHWLEKHKDKCEATRKGIKKIAVDGDEGKLEFKCEICFRRYNSIFWFDRHKEKCNSSTPSPCVVLPPKQQKVVRCQNCNKTYSNDYWLEYHTKHCRAGRQSVSHEMEVEMPVLIDNSLQLREDEVEEEKGVEVYGKIKTSEEGCSSSKKEEDDLADVAPRVDHFGIEPEEEESGTDESTTSSSIRPQCSICGMQCTGVASLLHHRKRVHGMTAMLTCGICSKQCNSMSTIRRHISQEYSLYVCQTCGRNCADRSALQQHICFKPFKIRDTHLMNKQNHTALNCQNCMESFSNSNDFRNHRISCGTGKIVEPTSKNPNCRSDEETIREAYQSRMIVSVEKGDPTPSGLKCPECYETFSFLSDLTTHRMQLHGKLMFQCSYCPKVLQNYRALHDHHMICFRSNNDSSVKNVEECSQETINSVFTRDSVETHETL